jgi:hypothetical protein
MKAYVLNKNKEPLMPTTPAIARILLKEGKAKVVKKTPFTIQLLNDSTGFKQPIAGGLDINDTQRQPSGNSGGLDTTQSTNSPLAANSKS